MADDIYGLLGSTDLQGFNQAAQAQDPYGIAGRSLQAWQPNTETWSPGATATSFAKAFLSTYLGQQARQNAADQTNAVINVLPQLAANPLAVTAPEGVPENLFADIKGAAALRNAQRQAAGQAAKSSQLSDLVGTIFSEGVKNQTITPGEAINAAKTGDIDSLLNKPSIDPLKNPKSPQYQADKDSGDIERKYTETLLTGTAAKEAMNINRAATNILEAVKKDNPLAASTAIFEFAKLQDPTGTVREGDELRVSDPGGPLGQLARTFNEIQQLGKLTKEGKAAMRELVPVLQKNTFEQYNQIKDGLLTAAKSYGADPSRVQYVKPTDLTSYLTEPMDARTFALKAKAAGMSIDQARAAWAAQGGQ